MSVAEWADTYGIHHCSSLSEICLKSSTFHSSNLWKETYDIDEEAEIRRKTTALSYLTMKHK